MKKTFSKFILFFICIILSVIFPSLVFTQDMSNSQAIADLKGFNRNAFDIHFNRADRELSPERWLSEAKWGINQALCAWELYASALFDSSFKLEEAKIMIENWCNEELEIRFSNWLMERFFGELAEKSISNLHTMLAVNNDEIFEESFDWRSEKNDFIIASGNALTDNFHYLYVELLDYIPSEMRESMNNIILNSAAKATNLLKSEFENIAARQERIFARRRMPDYLNNEYQTYLAKKTARHLADQLIIETEEFCSLGINEIKVIIEQASAGTGDLVLLGDEWLQLYKEQFERGLKAWQDAEERFFMRRIEWEQETFNVYSEGEDVWYDAFINFENKRTEWELLIKNLLEEGEKYFKNISKDFERNIEEAKAEFEINAAIRAGTVSAKIKALSDMYLVCVSAAESMRENIIFMEKRIYGKSIVDPKDKIYPDWLTSQRLYLWQSTLDLYSNDYALKSNLKKLETLEKNIEIERKKEINTEGKEEEEIEAENEEKEKRIEAAIQAYNDHLEYLHTHYEPYYKIPKMINREFSVDEELLYLKELENLHIVNSQKYKQYMDLHNSYELYASYVDKSAEVRDTIISDFSEIFGFSALKDILLKDMSSEDFCLDEYQIALIRANTLVQYWERKTHIAEVITKLSIDYENGLVNEDDIYEVWKKAKAAYEESIILYNNEIETLNNISGDITAQQQILDNLSKIMKIEEDKLAKLNSQYSALLMANVAGQSDFLTKDLKNKYALLVNEYERLFNTGDNASYKNLLEYGAKYSSAELLETAENILNILINGNNKDIQSLSELKNTQDKNVEINLRLAAIEMFADSNTNQLRSPDSAYGSADWYFKVKEISSVNFDTKLLYGENLGLQLTNDVKDAFKNVYLERIKLELAAVKEYVEFILNDDEYKKNDEDNMIIEIYNTLLNLRKLLETDKFDKINYENDIISEFFSGSSFFINGDEGNLPALYDEYRYCSGLLEIYNNYTMLNTFTLKEAWQQSLSKLNRLFNNNGIYFNNNYLPDVKLICDAITEKPGNLFHNTSVFLIEFNNCFNLLPVWLYNEITYWQQSIQKYIAAYAFVNNINTPNISSVTEEQIIESNINFIIMSMKTEYSTNEKFWRQYLSDSYINDYDNMIDFKPDLVSGLLTDTLEIANYYTNRLRDSFMLFSNKNIDLSAGNSKIFYYLYLNEITKEEQELYSLNNLKNDISRIGAAYDYMNMSQYNAEYELKRLSDALNKQEGIINDIYNEYMSAAIIYEKYGNEYNKQYNLVKSVYDESNKNRYEYELRDSIIRYISTIYMDFELFDLEQCKEKLNRAKTVLKVLTDLYSGEYMRSYQNNEYNELYSAYEKSFTNKILVMEAFKTVSDEIAKAINNYNYWYNCYVQDLYKLGNVNQDYSGYISPDDIKAWTLKDIITVNNGRLAFSLNEGILTGVDSSKADALVSYFSDNITPSGEVNQFSEFHNALYGLSQRMSVYFSNPSKYKLWSLARDYLLYKISDNNNVLEFLAEHISGLGELKENGSLYSLPIKIEPSLPTIKLSTLSILSINNLAYRTVIDFAWNCLSEDEKADLEFYTILTFLAGSNNYSQGFSMALTLNIYNDVQKEINDINKAYENINEIPIIGFFTGLYNKELLETNYNTLSKVDIIKSRAENTYNDWISILNYYIQYINYSSEYYQYAVNNLISLNKKMEDGQSISWTEIENMLITSKNFTNDQINTLKSCWVQMQEKYNEKYSTLYGALTGLLYWAKSVEEESKIAFENRWLQDEQQRITNENYFNKLTEEYIAGNGSLTGLRIAANSAYGADAAAWKNHFENLKNLLFDHLFNQEMSHDNNNELNNVAYDLSVFSQRATNARFSAELSAREIEWEQMRQELVNNYNEWLKIAAMLVERGRADWAAGKVKMESAYLSWTQQFKDEYDRVNDEWSNAYLFSLLDKQQWIKAATEAAEQASDNQFLLYIGTEAERLSRLMDTREPLGFHVDIQNANELLNEVLYYNGISNIYNALNVINNIANISSPLVKRGLGGVSMWNVSLVKLNASDTIKQANKIIADNEAVKLAYEASVTASQIIDSIYEYVGNANDDFRKSMDDHFILNGFWTRSGNNYVKDVIIGSTLTKPVITETHTITGYKDYVVEQLYIRTRTDIEYLKNLESLAIMALLENVHFEVEQIVNDIFGVGKDSIKINKEAINKKKVTSYVNNQYITEYKDEVIKLDERQQAPGKFGAYIGYQPAVKPSEYIGQTRDTFFYDEGGGELGRLISDYIYWSIIEGKGMAELSLPVWDKRMWDDTDTFFNAPTIRGTAQTAAAIAGTVVAVALTPVTGGASLGAALGIISATAAVSSSADFVFNSLDASLGYKTWDEALFASAKTYTLNFVSGAISQGTNFITAEALKTSTGAASNIFIRTSLAGTGAAYSTVASSALSGINYTSANGWSYSKDAFNAGINKLLSDTLTSMASSFVSSSLEMINSGWNGNKVSNFSGQNIKDLGKFNGLIGDLAGQGVNYALGNDFTLNLLNMSLLTNDAIKSGLLELHLSHDNSPTMNIGTGGANVSVDNLYYAFKGALVWNENIQNDIFKMKTNIDISAAFRGVYGFGDKAAKKLVKDLRSGKTGLEVKSEEDYFAETINSDGKLKLVLGRYADGMTSEDQLYLAAILQHEAYRDGFKEGEINKYGHIISYEDSFNELKTASIARIEMAERINAEYKWFLLANEDLLYEQILLSFAKDTGDYSLYDTFLEIAFNNDNDYYFIPVNTNGDYQSNYRGVPLINSVEETKNKNEQRLQKGFEKYKLDMSGSKETEESLWETYSSDITIQKKYGGNPLDVETIDLLGCMLMSTKYGVEAITGNKINTLWFNNYIKEKGLFNKDSDLSKILMAKIMTKLTYGEYIVSYVDMKKDILSVEELYNFAKSEDIYLAHLRVKTNTKWNHSVMLNEIIFNNEYNEYEIGISAIIVANPSTNKTSVTGKQTYTMDDIARIDIFKVTPVKSAERYRIKMYNNKLKY